MNNQKHQPGQKPRVNDSDGNDPGNKPKRPIPDYGDRPEDIPTIEDIGQKKTNTGE